MNIKDDGWTTDAGAWVFYKLTLSTIMEKSLCEVYPLKPVLI